MMNPPMAVVTDIVDSSMSEESGPVVMAVIVDAVVSSTEFSMISRMKTRM